MTKPIHNYQGDQRSLMSDACYLVHLRAINIAAGDRGVSFSQLWIDSDNQDFSLAPRTAQQSLRRLTRANLLLYVAGKGRKPSGYYAPYCSLERMKYALRFGVNDDKMYAPDDSPVCLVWESPCECYSTLVAVEQGMEIYFHKSITPSFVQRSGLSIWRRRVRTLPLPRELDSALRFIKQLRGFEEQLGGLDVWEIPSVKHILDECRRFGVSPLP